MNIHQEDIDPTRQPLGAPGMTRERETRMPGLWVQTGQQPKQRHNDDEDDIKDRVSEEKASGALRRR